MSDIVFTKWDIVFTVSFLFLNRRKTNYPSLVAKGSKYIFFDFTNTLIFIIFAMPYARQ